MNIKQALELDNGVSGIALGARIVKVLPPKSHTGAYGSFTTQYIVVADDSGEVLVKITEKTVGDSYTNAMVTIGGAKLVKYTKGGEEKSMLEVPSKGTFELGGPHSAETKPTATEKPVAKEPKVVAKVSFEDILPEAIKETNSIINDIELGRVLTAAKDNGWSSEDVRSILISRMIEKARKSW